MIGLFISVLWGRLKGAYAALCAFTAKCPLCAVCAALALLAVVQTWRLSVVKHSLTTARAEITKFSAAQVEAERQAQQAIADTERKYRDKANEADRSYQAALGDARAATQRYIDLHRVRQDGSRPASQAVASASGGSAGVPTPLPAGIIVDQADVQSCGDLYAYAVKAHDWAATLPK